MLFVPDGGQLGAFSKNVRKNPAAARVDEAIKTCQTLRERFPDDEFRQFSMLREGEFLRGKGREYYPCALALFRSARDIRSDSPYAEQAGRWIMQLTRTVLSGMTEDISPGG